VALRIKLKQQSWLNSKLAPVSEQATPVDKRLEPEQCYFSQMHESVRLASRLHFMPTRCLPRSIVLADMLRAKRYSARVVLGVAKNGGALSSHAWVEVNGDKVAEPEGVEQNFKRLI